MFIVAITLGLLAAMGVYGLTATAQDVRAAGHGRMAAQTQHAAELAMVVTSQLLEPGNAQVVVNKMRADEVVRAAKKQECKTARPFNTADNVANRDAQACLVLTPVTMRALAQDQASWPADIDAVTKPFPFSPESFGEVPSYAHVRVELTNPVDWEAPSGNGVTGSPFIFTQVRATVFVEMRPNTAAGAGPADSVAVGRGRLVVGPYQK